MSAVEAAASLFGDSVDSSDFFGSADDASEPEPQFAHPPAFAASEPNALFLSDDFSAPELDLSQHVVADSLESLDAFTPTILEQPTDPDTFPLFQQPQSYPPVDDYVPAQPVYGYAGYPSQPSWYSQPSNLPTREPAAAAPSTYTGFQPLAPHNPFDPYKPATAPQQAPNDLPYSSSSYQPQSRPAIPSPPTNAHQHTLTDPPYSRSSYQPTPPPPPQHRPSIPPPPKPLSHSVEMYRPSSKSAYDPPAFTKRASTMSLRRDAGRFTPPSFPPVTSSPQTLHPQRPPAPPVRPPSQSRLYTGTVPSPPRQAESSARSMSPPRSIVSMTPDIFGANPEQGNIAAVSLLHDEFDVLKNRDAGSNAFLMSDAAQLSSRHTSNDTEVLVEEDPESLFNEPRSSFNERGLVDYRTDATRYPAPSLADDSASPKRNGNLGRYDDYTPRMQASSDTGRSLISEHPDPYDPYAPPPPTQRFHDSEVVSSIPPGLAAARVDGPPATAIRDPYAPPASTHFGGGRASRNSSKIAPQYSIPFIPQPIPPIEDIPHPMESMVTVTELQPAPLLLNQNQYAPSPSLLGTNDPLSRHSARAPVFSFGFGGQVVSCFHLSQVSSGGFDVAMSSQETKQVRLRILKDLIPSFTLEDSSNEVPFPGPLFGDPGTAGSGLMGAGTAAIIKTKKAQVLNYLQERADEVEKGLGHLIMNSTERQKAESKLVLFRLLLVLVENDGSFTGSPAESVARQALSSALGPSGAFASNAGPAYLEQPISVTTLRSSALTTLEQLLLAGERREAYQFAMGEKLWAHALIIAQGLDKEAWNEVLGEFIRCEIGSSKRDQPDSSVSHFEGLTVAYGLLGGFGASSVQQLVPHHANLNTAHGSHQTQQTPVTPNFVPPVQGAVFPLESLPKWPAIASVCLSSTAPGSSAALTALGDHLTSHGWTDAAHCCYLLSPHTSSLGGAGLSSTRAVLLGLSNPMSIGAFHKLSDPIILTEIAEFALSLASSNKAQEPFAGLAHLQAYRLIRAYQLADLGHTTIAMRYCEAIGTSLRLNNRGSSLYTQPLLEHLKELSDRLTGAPQQSHNKSWVIGKVSKPSLDTLGGWLEGRIKNFIVGDGENELAQGKPNPSTITHQTPAGPFATYSAISSTNTSQSPSPSPSIQNTASPSTSYQVQRSASVVHGTIRSTNRPPSALGYMQSYRTASPVTQSAPSSTTVAAVTGTNPYTPDNEPPTARSTLSPGDSPSATGSWWAGSQEGSAGRTPTATTFRTAERSPTWPDSAYQAPSGNLNHSNGRTVDDDDDDDDELGLGNNNKRRKNAEGKVEEKREGQAEETPKTEPVTAEPVEVRQSGSWFGWIWKQKEAAPPGPVRAKLGEENSFYYDKELKRWVNKKAGGADTSKPTPPPPPPARHATAPPESAPPTKFQFPESGGSGPPGPPLRPNSAIDVRSATLHPTKARSNLAPPPSGAAPPSSSPTPPSRSSSTAPPGRPKSSVSKRSVRSRYVDVFQQPAEEG